MNISNFIEELKKINICPTKRQLQQLEKYYELLVEYNKVMNLTGITDKETVYLKHFYDSLTIAKVIDLNKEYTLCDIGTGAGFPGLVLKIMFPNLKITLVDCLNKRIQFLNNIIEELELNNIITIHSRIEDYGRFNKDIYDIVTARAVSSLNILLEYSIPLLKVGGYFIPMKGKLENEPDYKTALEKLNCKVEKCTTFKLPVENSDRNILLIKKINVTNKKYPRINSLIVKSPL